MRGSFPNNWHLWPPGRGGQVEVELLLLDETNELPLIGERAVVVPRQLAQYNLARLADAEGMLEQLDKCLGGKRWRWGIRCCLQGGEIVPGVTRNTKHNKSGLPRTL